MREFDGRFSMTTCKAAATLAAMAIALGSAHATPTVEATLTVGNQAPVMCTDSVLAKAFVPNFADGTLSVIDVDALKVSATVAVGRNPRRLACNEATHLLYVANATSPGTVTVVDAKTGAVVKTIPVGDDPRNIGANFLIDEVYVSNYGSNTVSIISTATNAVVATVAVGTAPLAPTSNNNLYKTYVPSATDGTVSVIDQKTRAVTTTIKVGNGPQFAAIDGAHGKVYVNNVTDRTVSVIDSAIDTVVRTIATGAGTSSNFGVVNAVYHRYYLPNATDGTVTVIGTATDDVVHTIAVGATPVDALSDAGTGDLYVVNQGGNSVTIINAQSDIPIGSYAVGGAPARIYEMGDRLFVLNGNGANPDSVTVSTKQNTIIGTLIATEFYHAGFDHYFHTADETETSLIRDGLFDDNWHRTFEFWRVWDTPGDGRVAVCRFFSPTFAPRSSHFYTPYPNECAQRQAEGVWQLESAAVFYLVLTDATGNCPCSMAPLYRVYNKTMGGAPNHRYMASRELRNQMVAQGWVAEGNGPDVIFACTPRMDAFWPPPPCMLPPPAP
jgi:YVTN family beta-propeller protein